MQLLSDLKSGKCTLESLKNNLFIKVKEYDDRFVLNYDQIQSPKSDPYVMQCRGLVIDRDYNALCLPFDRFFNLGESIDHNKFIKWNDVECFEKVDGSLSKIYFDGCNWCAATRGTAFGESDVYGWDLTFKQLMYKAVNVNSDDDFNALCNKHLDKNISYMFEVTSRENRVVTQYDGYTLWYLASRLKDTGDYIDLRETIESFGARIPKSYRFGNVEECVHTASNLPDLQEGYVLYQDGKPFCKIKSPSYVAIHHIKGEGLNPKRIMEIVLLNECDEYLKYFPEDEVFFTPYIQVMSDFEKRLVVELNEVKDICDQKEFALMVKDKFYSSIFFNWKRGKGTITDCFHDMPMSYKLKILENLSVGYV